MNSGLFSYSSVHDESAWCYVALEVNTYRVVYLTILILIAIRLLLWLLILNSAKPKVFPLHFKLSDSDKELIAI